MKSVLIIGSEGFIGSHCVQYYLSKGWNVYGCDLIDYPRLSYTYYRLSRLQPSFDEVFAQQSYTVCINAAGNGSVPVSIEHPLTDFEANCSDVIRILEFLRKGNNGCKYIHISSAAVYGNPQSLPVQEDSQVQPLSPYGWHKLIAEKLCEEYTALYKIPVSVVRPFSVYGPGLRKQLIWDMAQKIRLSSNERIELWGTGSESRDFMYISDLVNAISIVAEHTSLDKCNIYNLASGTETTIANLAQIFFREMQPDADYFFNGQSRPGDPKNWRASMDKLFGIGYKQNTDLESGIKKTVEWLKKQG